MIADLQTQLARAVARAALREEEAAALRKRVAYLEAEVMRLERELTLAAKDRITRATPLIPRRG